MAFRDNRSNIFPSPISRNEGFNHQGLELRGRYTELIQATQAHGNDTDMSANDALYEILDAADQLYESNKEYMQSNPSVVELDLRCLHLCASLSRAHAQSIVIKEHIFKPDEFSKKLNESFSGWKDTSKVDWSKIGSTFLEAAYVVPKFEYFFGTLPKISENLPTKTRKPRTSYKEKNESEAIKPQEPTSLQGEEKTSKQVEHIYRKMKRCGMRSVCYFKLVIDPLSYSKTIENMFHISFLIKDGHLGLILGPDGSPKLYVLTDEEKKKNDKGQGRQMLLSLEYDDWEKVKAAYNIKRAII